MTVRSLELIIDCGLFDGLAADRLVRVAALFGARVYEHGALVAAPGEQHDRVEIVASGAVRVTRVGEDGRAVGMALLGPGELFGAIGVGDASDRIDAVERTVILSADAADFERLMLDEPLIALRVIAALNDRLALYRARIESLAFLQVPARFARVLIALADRHGRMTSNGIRIDLRITHGQFAEMVVTTRETLTKTAGWLRSEGLATLERRRVWIHDLAGLEQVASGERQMPGRIEREQRRRAAASEA